MKKILALLLALIMCVSCLAIFSSCNDTNDNDGEGTNAPTDAPVATDAPATLDAAKTFLFGMYKDSASPKTDYDIVGKVMIGTTAFTVTWTVDSDKIAIVESSKADFWTVDLPDANDAEFEYTLTATIKDAAGTTVEVSFKRTMGVVDNTGVVTAPVADVPYKLFVEQGTLEQTLFALNTTQNDDGKYINTTNDPKEASDYYVEVVDGGFKFYTDVNGTKTYVNAHVVKTEDGKFSKYLGLSATEASVWTYNADKTGWIVNLEGVDYYIGTYNAYATLSISEASYLKPESIGVSSFTCGFMTKEYAETLEPDAEKEIEIPTNKDAVQPTAGEKYNISMIQGNKDNATYYLTGSMNGYYMATSTNAADAANAYVEAVDGGYNLYVIAAGAKLYINVVRSGSHINNVFEETASTVWVWDDALKTLKAELEGEFYVLGTSATGTYVTFGMVKAAEKNFYGQFTVSTLDDQAGSEGGDDDDTATPEEIVNAAWELAPGETYGECTLTGVVSEITDPYSTQYKNVTFVMIVAGLTDKPITVFRAKGDCADKIAEGDTVTVTGTLLNFVYDDAEPTDPGLVEFNSGCTLSGWVDADGEGGSEGGDEGGSTTPPATDGLTLTYDNLFAGIDGTGYADYNGDHTVDGVTVNTDTVMKSNNNTGGIDVIQLKKLDGVITIKNVSVSKLTIRVVSSYDYSANVSVTLGGNALTLPSPADIQAARVTTGISNANGYEIFYYDIVVDLGAATAGDLVIHNTTNYAVYFEYVIVE